MVRLQTLDLRIGVRVPASQPFLLPFFVKPRQKQAQNLRFWPASPRPPRFHPHLGSPALREKAKDHPRVCRWDNVCCLSSGALAPHLS